MPITDTPFPQTGVDLAPLTGTKPPKHRLENAVKAQNIVWTLWNAAQERNLKYAAIQGQIDGNPPYSPARMRSAGRASDANFNTLTAKAIRSAALVPYFDLFAGGNRYVEIRLDAFPDEFRTSTISGIASEEYDRLLRRWRNLENVMHGIITDMVTFGRGHGPWEALGSWRFTKVPFYRILTPDGTPIDDDRLECLVILQDWPVATLYKNIKDRSTAQDAGWNVSETLSAIANAVPSDPSVPNDPMAVQAMLRDSDIYVSARSSTVQTATVFVREFDGKWSELMVRRDQIPNMSQATSEISPVEFMFKAFDRYDCVQEIINNFFFEVSDNDWNGASGYGKDIFTIAQLMDRVECCKADSMFLRNSIVMQPKQATDKQKLNLLQIGKATYVPENMEVLNSTILGDITSTIEMSRELMQLVERNTGIYRPTLEKVKGNPETLGEFQMKFAQATVLSAAAISRFYSQLDRLYEEQWERVIETGTKGKWNENGSREDWQNEARGFVYCCEKRGVTKEELKKIEYIRAFRNIGNGSAAMRQQALSQLLSVYPLYPADGQLNILEDFTRSVGSQTAVQRYLPATARQNLPNDQVWEAMVENGLMKQGAPVTWTPSQNNLIHAQTHLQAGAQAAASLQAGTPMLDVLAFLDAIGQHVAVHIERERNKPTSKEPLKAIEQEWKRLAQITDELRSRAEADAEKQAQLQQQQQEVLTDADIKRLDVLMKNQTSREKMFLQYGLRQEKQNLDNQLKVEKQQVDNTLADASTAAEIERNLAKARTDQAVALTK